MQRATSPPSIYLVAFLGGISGALVMTVFIALYHTTGYSLVHIERTLVRVLTGQTGAKAWIFGFIWHLLNGGVFALIYAFGFARMRRAGPVMGIIFGFFHWCIAEYLLGILKVFRLPDFSALFVFSLHLLYGFIVGTVCNGARFEEFSKPETSEREIGHDEEA